MSSIFNEHNSTALLTYLGMARKHKQFNELQAYDLALAAVHYYQGNASAREALAPGQALERRWYESLRNGNADYSVYDDDFFVSDIWACWVVYSRKYLRLFLDPSERQRLGAVATVADLGCGIGYTTAALKELFPHADVYGTQLQSSFQYRVATEVGQQRGFTVLSDREAMPHADLVFASEYFEHFERPINHLVEVLHTASPRCLIIANSFGSQSIGHFDEYLDAEGKKVSNKMIGRRFNDALRAAGFKSVSTHFWNNRPAVWTR